MKHLILPIQLLLLTICSCGHKQQTTQAEMSMSLINEDHIIIAEEADLKEREIREVFSASDKYHIGKKIFPVLDTINALTNQILDETHAIAANVNPSDIDYLYKAYNTFIQALLANLNTFFKDEEFFLGAKEEDIERHLSSIEKRLAFQQLAANTQPRLSLVFLISKIVKARYELIKTVKSMYSYRGPKHIVKFPVVMNFGSIKPIKEKEEAKVQIGVQTYDILDQAHLYKILILGDTLSFEQEQDYIEYLLPTHIKGENKLPVELLYEDRFGGQQFRSSATFKYEVN